MKYDATVTSNICALFTARAYPGFGASLIAWVKITFETIENKAAAANIDKDAFVTSNDSPIDNR